MYLGTIALFPPHQQEPKKKTDDYITHGQEKGKKKKSNLLGPYMHTLQQTPRTHGAISSLLLLIFPFVSPCIRTFLVI